MYACVVCVCGVCVCGVCVCGCMSVLLHACAACVCVQGMLARLQCTYQVEGDVYWVLLKNW